MHNFNKIVLVLSFVFIPSFISARPTFPPLPGDVRQPEEKPKTPPKTPPTTTTPAPKQP